MKGGKKNENDVKSIPFFLFLFLINALATITTESWKHEFAIRFEKGKIQFGGEEEWRSGDEIRYWYRRVIAGTNSAGERDIEDWLLDGGRVRIAPWSLERARRGWEPIEGRSHATRGCSAPENDLSLATRPFFTPFVFRYGTLASPSPSILLPPSFFFFPSLSFHFSHSTIFLLLLLSISRLFIQILPCHLRIKRRSSVASRTEFKDWRICSPGIPSIFSSF